MLDRYLSAVIAHDPDNGLFHLVQIVAVLLIASGLRPGMNAAAAGVRRWHVDHVTARAITGENTRNDQT